MAHRWVKIGLVVYLTTIVGVWFAVCQTWPSLYGSFFVTILPAGYLGLTAAVAIMSVVKFRFHSPAFALLSSWEQLPPSLRERTSREYPAIAALGLELQAYLVMRAQVQSVTGVILLLCDAERTTIALWTLTDTGAKQTSSVDLVSNSTTGESCSTNQCNCVLPIMHSQDACQFPQVSDLPTLLALHRHRVQFHLRGRQLETLPAGEEAVLKWVNTESARDMARKAGLGFYAPTDGGRQYRPTLWFTWPTALCSLPPLRWLPRAWQRWQGASELRRVGWKDGMAATGASENPIREQPGVF